MENNSTLEIIEKLRYNVIEIAKLEFEKGVVPITVKRLTKEGEKNDKIKTRVA